MRAQIKDFLTTRLVKREPTWAERLALITYEKLLPASFRELQKERKELIEKTRVAVYAGSDGDFNLFRQFQWGDYWFRYEMIKALGELGFLVVEPHRDPDIVIHLFGRQVKVFPKRAFKVVWIHSHPEGLSSDFLARYDQIACISTRTTEQIRQMGFACELLSLATSKTPRAKEFLYDLAFVGNARGNGRRPILDALGDSPYRLNVWGMGYTHLSAPHFVAPYVDYHRLEDIYGAAHISLNDHRESMQREGFLNPRIYDILGSGGFCISDANPAIDEIFGDCIPQYRSSEELRELVAHFMTHPEERNALAKKGHQIVRDCRWSKVARALTKQGLALQRKAAHA